MNKRIIFIAVATLLMIDNARACDSIKIDEIQARLDDIEAQKLGEQIYDMRDQIYGLEGFVTELQNILSEDPRDSENGSTLGDVVACEAAGTPKDEY